MPTFLQMRQAIRYRVGVMLNSMGWTAHPSWKSPRHQLNLLEACVPLLWNTPHICDELIIVQVGAFDGAANAPLTRVLATGRFSSAILIEPQPGPAQALRRRYDGTTSIVVLEGAIADKDGPVTLFSSSDSDQRASIDAGHLVNRFGIQENKLSVHTVEGLTVDSLLRRFSIGKINLLQIDCESYDLVILKRFLAHTHPNLINFEHFHLTQSDRKAARDLLQDDYYFLETAMDTFGVSKRFLDTYYV